MRGRVLYPCLKYTLNVANTSLESKLTFCLLLDKVLKYILEQLKRSSVRNQGTFPISGINGLPLDEEERRKLEQNENDFTKTFWHNYITRGVNEKWPNLSDIPKCIDSNNSL